MTKNEVINLRIAELEGRLLAARQLVMNKAMRVEEKLIEAQIEALLGQYEREVLNADPADEIIISQTAGLTYRKSDA